jgi:hypothetical protein
MTVENGSGRERPVQAARWRVRVRQLLRWWLPASLVVAAGVLWYALPRLDRSDRIQGWLEDPSPELRKRAAWRIGEREITPLLPEVVAQLGDEPDPSVREALIHAISQVGGADELPLLETLLVAEEQGFPRQKTWIAIAAIDAARFEALATRPALIRDDWDRLGIAIARFRAGQFGDLEQMLTLAQSDQATIQLLARRALERYVRPVMVIAGRWPIEAGVMPSGLWTPGVLAEIGRRAGEIELDEVAVEVAASMERAAPMRTSLRRMTRSRNQLADLLFD